MVQSGQLKRKKKPLSIRLNFSKASLMNFRIALPRSKKRIVEGAMNMGKEGVGVDRQSSPISIDGVSIRKFIV